MALAACWILVGLLALPASADFLVTFYLVPESDWSGGAPPPEALLHDGEVTFYRQGSFEPALRLSLGESAVVPAGRWSWIGEAPGYVTVAAGSLHVSDAKAAPGTVTEKRILWPAVPACDLILAGEWRGVERVDVAALGHGAAYPTVRPRVGLLRRVPAGPWIAYGVRSGGLTGMSAVGRCRQNEKLRLPPPLSPPPDRQDLMVHAVLPAEPAVGGGVESHLSIAGSVVLPAARLDSGRRTTFFYRRVPAQADARLSLHHPELRTVTTEVEPVGGGSRELETFGLEHRADVELSVDYLPRRPHRLAQLEVLHCGRSPDARYAPGRCSPVAERPLREGYATYRFEDLDDGRYLFSARVDDEWVAGLGHGVFPYVTPEKPDALRPPPLRLEEMEVWGQLRVDGREVAGEVTLVPRDDDLPLRRATTDGRLVYRLNYFGGLPDSYDRRLLPERVAALDDDELLGLYGDYRIQACDREARCRALPLRSFLIGSGRLDFDLGADRGLLIEVVDVDSGEPVPRAPVISAAGDRRRLLFAHGEALWLPRHGGEALPRLTGADGVARLRDLPVGEVGFLVKPRGYRRAEGRALVPESGWARLRVEVTRSRGRHEVELRFADGRPVAGAYFVVFAADGARRPRCDAPTSPLGVAGFDASCLEATRLVLLHPEVALAVHEGRALAATPSLAVDQAPSVPIRLRLVDDDGSPVSSAAVELSVGGLTLGPGELLAPLSAYLPPLFYVSDASGEVLLRGVDPAVGAPRVRLHRDGLRGEVALIGRQPGETIVVPLAP